MVKKYVQIPLDRCAGQKGLFKRIGKVLDEHGYKTNIDGLVFTIERVKKEVIENGTKSVN